MNTARKRTHAVMSRTGVVVAATALAALGFAGPAAADTTVYDQSIGGKCLNPPECEPVTVQFNAFGAITATFTPDPNPGCFKPQVEGRIDDRFPLTLGQRQTIGTETNHSLVLHARCADPTATRWSGRLTIDAFDFEAPAGQAPATQPKQGPTVTATPGVLGVTFHITDRSGVASQCTYSSEGFTSDSFALAANGSFDLFVPAIREFRTRTGTVTCDNGTSAPTSVVF
jgi:hypothetical protein